MRPLQKLKDSLAREAFGETKQEAQQFGSCIYCKQLALPRYYSEAGKREYRISGLCELCFDEITEEAETATGGNHEIH